MNVNNSITYGSVTSYPQNNCVVSTLPVCVNDSNQKREKVIQDYTSEQMGDCKNVVTSKGTVDILNNTEIVVVEFIENWMTGVARLYLLIDDFPMHNLILHLIITPSNENYVRLLNKIKNSLINKNIIVRIQLITNKN
jgi:hypothetical protein